MLECVLTLTLFCTSDCDPTCESAPCCDSCRPTVCKILLGHSTCDMAPHMWYYPEAHGYYYFRPYHHDHVVQHQRTATAWGIDPRNPYSNEVFKKIYEEAESNPTSAIEMK